MRGISILAAAVVAISLTASDGHSLELGLRPSHVYSLWTNLNECIIASGKVVSSDKNWNRRLSTMKPAKFSGKNPTDVLRLAREVRTKIDRLRSRTGLHPLKWTYEDHTVVTPTTVYLNSGKMLDGLTEWLIKRTGPDELISKFYRPLVFRGKTPSDVFSMVDLANQRLDRVVAKLGR